MNKIQIGTIGVDAGLCWVGDPCYIMGKDSSYYITTWDEFCNKHDKAVNESEFGWSACEPLGEGIGFAISTGYGDGEYPVYIEKEGSRIKRIIIEFIDEEEDYDS